MIDRQTSRLHILRVAMVMAALAFAMISAPVAAFADEEVVDTPQQEVTSNEASVVDVADDQKTVPAPATTEEVAPTPEPVNEPALAAQPEVVTPDPTPAPQPETPVVTEETPAAEEPADTQNASDETPAADEPVDPAEPADNQQDTPAAAEQPEATEAPAPAPAAPAAQNETVAAAADQAAKTVKDGLYEIKPTSKSANNVSVKGGSTNNGAAVVSAADTDATSQRFFIEYDQNEGFYRIHVLNSGKDVSINGTSAGSAIVQSNSASLPHLWEVIKVKSGIYSFKNHETGLLMTLAGTTFKAMADTGTYTSAQQFTLTAEDLLANGIYQIAARTNASLVLEVENGSIASNTKLHLGANGAKQSQKFEVVRVGSKGSGLYRIRTAASGGWLTETNDSGSGKNHFVKQVGNSKTAVSDANTWEVCWDGDHWALRSVLSGRVLGVADGKIKAGTQLRVFKADAGTNQHFEFVPTPLVADGYYAIKSSAVKRVLTVDPDSTANGGLVTVAANRRGGNQKYEIKKVGDYYTITNYYSGRSIQIKKASKKNGAKVVQWKSNSSNNQKWDIRIGDNGTLVFVNVNSGRVLYVAGNKKSVAQRAATGSNRESWTLVEAEPDGWYRSGSHWRFKSTRKGSKFENDIDSSGKSLRNYDILHDLWLKIRKKKSKTKYLIASSWDACYVGVFVGRKNHWEPYKGFNCANGNAALIEAENREENPGSTWKWSPTFDRYLAKSNIKSRMPELPPNNAWAAKLGTTYKKSRVRRVNANEKYFTSISWTLGYHTYLHSKKELGRHLSHGCQRLAPVNAKWIYKYIYPGTRCMMLRTKVYE